MLVKYKDVTSNCFLVSLQSASNQELEIAFMYDPNDEADKISNLSEALDQLSSNGCKNQVIIGARAFLSIRAIGAIGPGPPHNGGLQILHI